MPGPGASERTIDSVGGAAASESGLRRGAAIGMNLMASPAGQAGPAGNDTEFNGFKSGPKPRVNLKLPVTRIQVQDSESASSHAGLNRR